MAVLVGRTHADPRLSRSAALSSVRRAVALGDRCRARARTAVRVAMTVQPDSGGRWVRTLACGHASYVSGNGGGGAEWCDVCDGYAAVMVAPVRLATDQGDLRPAYAARRATEPL